MMLEKNISNAFNNTAVLVVDVTTSFCKNGGAYGNEDTDHVAQKIAKVLPKFRDAGMPIYAVYSMRYVSENPTIEEGDFYKIDIKNTDHLICKNRNSALYDLNIVDEMFENGIENVIICGVNFSACVCDTALSARANGFDTIVLEDLCADGNIDTSKFGPGSVRYMFDGRGILRMKSKEILKTLPNKTPSTPKNH